MSTCTLTISPSPMASVATLSPSNSFTRRYGRPQSSPVNSPYAQSSPSGSKIIGGSPSSSEKSLAESVNMLAALPSLSKSLNNLPSLAGQAVQDVPVYEGMPSRAQKSSHEKLRTALGNACSKEGPYGKEKNGFYSNPFFSMTPVHVASASAPNYRASHPSAMAPSSRMTKQKTFSFHGDEDDDDEDC